MADARQKEMNVSITVVATKTLTAGRETFCVGDDMPVGWNKRKPKNLTHWPRAYQCG